MSKELHLDQQAVKQISSDYNTHGKLYGNTFVINSGKFEYLKQAGQCPICLGIDRRDCRTNGEGLYFCRSNNNLSIEYSYTGKTDKQGFKIYSITAQKRNYDKKIIILKSEKTQVKNYMENLIDYYKPLCSVNEIEVLPHNVAVVAEFALTAVERDIEYKILLSELILIPEHKHKLLARGLTEKDIEKGQYKSIVPYQKLKNKYNPRLAGINQYGNALKNGTRGILGPILDINGLIVAGQIKPDDNNGYPWLVGDDNLVPKPSCHLKNGELPLSIFDADGDSVGLCEGTSFKPFLANKRLKIPFIGASSGHHSGSPKTLKDALERFNLSQIILYPDSNCIFNTDIMNKYKLTFELIESWGYNFLVAWWDQLNKDKNKDITKFGDIDEININNTTFKYFSGSEFFGI